eukprot:TRINITY_DN5878_c0_g1_i2.p1 TRINITY_DN5878_c0_g1~~TRINITY_DN5878_c0_g1_i2.p1  ORF type:complete len:1252 (+),score=151.35 TRINITY_DN5878_c0_g1_i2:91-3846(+)
MARRPPLCAAGVLLVPRCGADLLVADYGNHRVQRCFTTGGHCQTLAGSGTAGAQLWELNSPTHVEAIDEVNFLVVDNQNNRILQCPMDGSGTSPPGCTVVGGMNGQGSGPGQMDKPSWISKHPGGGWMVSEWAGQRVSYCASLPIAAACTVMAGGNGGGSMLTQTNFPMGIGVVLSTQDLIIADEANHRVLSCPADGSGPTAGCQLAAGGSQGNSFTQMDIPTGLLMLSDAEYLVVDRNNNRILRCPFPGTLPVKCAVTWAGQTFLQPMGIARDYDGTYLVADSGSHQVLRCPVGIMVGPCTGEAGTAGSSGATTATFNNPYGVVASAAPPTAAPTLSPSAAPSAPPRRPTAAPSQRPSLAPSPAPSGRPSAAPSPAPSGRPSAAPSLDPSGGPTAAPTARPSPVPTASPIGPSTSPTAAPSGGPSAAPTSAPVAPTAAPSSGPSAVPSAAPIGPSPAPSAVPSRAPAAAPSAAPRAPSAAPAAPTAAPVPPTVVPTGAPLAPTGSPERPTAAPQAPTAAPTRKPSAAPSAVPIGPSPAPTQAPLFSPTAPPTVAPSAASVVPSAAPCQSPSPRPSAGPSRSPGAAPSPPPTGRPSAAPSRPPAPRPSAAPVAVPSTIPSQPPPTLAPHRTRHGGRFSSSIPSAAPTAAPSGPAGFITSPALESAVGSTADVSGGAAVAAAVAASPGGALSAMRLALMLGHLDCLADDVELGAGGGDSEDLEWTSSPVPLRISGSPHAGGVLVNTLLMACCALLLGAAGMLLATVRYSSSPAPKAAAAAYLRAPGVLALPAGFLFAGLIECTFELLFYPKDGAPIAIGAAGALLTGALLFWLIRLTSGAGFAAEALHSPDAAAVAWKRWLFGATVWGEARADGMFLDHYGLIFDCCRPSPRFPRGRFVLVEWAHLLPMAVTATVRASTLAGCAAKAFIQAVTLLLFTLACLAEKPYHALFLQVLSPLTAVLPCGGLVSVGWMFLDKDAGGSGEVPASVAMVLLSASGYVCMVRPIFDVVAWIMELQTGHTESVRRSAGSPAYRLADAELCSEPLATTSPLSPASAHSSEVWRDPAAAPAPAWPSNTQHDEGLRSSMSGSQGRHLTDPSCSMRRYSTAGVPPSATLPGALMVSVSVREPRAPRMRRHQSHPAAPAVSRSPRGQPSHRKRHGLPRNSAGSPGSGQSPAVHSYSTSALRRDQSVPAPSQSVRPHAQVSPSRRGAHGHTPSTASRPRTADSAPRSNRMHYSGRAAGAHRSPSRGL